MKKLLIFLWGMVEKKSQGFHVIDEIQGKVTLVTLTVARWGQGGLKGRNGLYEVCKIDGC